MTNEPGGDQDAADHRLLIGALVWARPGIRGRVFEMLAPGDLDTPLAADALEILRTLHHDGVTDALDLTEQFAATVHARAKARRTGDGLLVRYPVGPVTWLAGAYSDAARFLDDGAAVLALRWAGTGRRRALAHAAEELARVARSEEFDEDDIATVTEKLRPLLEKAS